MFICWKQICILDKETIISQFLTYHIVSLWIYLVQPEKVFTFLRSIFGSLKLGVYPSILEELGRSLNHPKLG